ncbi:biliverdin-producing heme oxygenase [Propionivibrio sp.]|uniref:biliverdin-producing heme oxygenase n=1 Tax=Propionivibrio sp. TaxID=2212460 RepID=UPI003BF31142
MDRQHDSPHATDDQGRPKRESVSAGLQRFTHAAHVHINRHPLLSGLTKPGYALDKYQALLAAYYHIYAVIERHIDAFLAVNALPFSYGERRKLPWLVTDLKYFGIDPETPDLSPLRPIALAPIDSAGELIGTLYAIEGATLGCQVLSRHLHETLGLTASSGACFFNGYGDAHETQRRWREFGVFANSIRANPKQQGAAELSALGVFEVIERQLDDYHARLDR